jgi:hypothetical protein
VSGTGIFIQQGFNQSAAGVYVGGFVPIGEASVTGSVYRATVGQLGTQTLPVSTIVQPAVHISAVLSTASLYYDSSNVLVTLQMFDASFSVQTTAVSVTVQLTPSSTLAVVDAIPRAAVVQCPAGAGGLCAVNVAASPSWFAPGYNSFVNVTYKFTGSGTPQFLGTVATWGQFFSAQGNAIQAVLPSKPLYPGDTFSFNILGNFTYLLASFTINLYVGPGIVLDRFTGPVIGGQNVFTITQAFSNGSQAATVAGIMNGYGSTAVQSAGQLLVTVTAHIAATAMPGGAFISLATTYLSNTLDSSVVPTYPAVLTGRAGVTTSGTNLVYVASDSVQGLLAYGAQGGLVNTAVLDGNNVSNSITVFGVGVRGGVSTITAQATCGGSDNTVLLVVGCQMVLTSAQTQGSLQTAVTVSAAGYTIKTYVAVWTPLVPITMQAVVSLLRPISNWFDASDATCQTLLYQSTEIAAWAVFTNTAANFTADVSANIAGVLTADAPLIAHVGSGGVVTGRSNGTTMVAATVHGRRIGSTSIVVSRAGPPARVIGLDAIAVTAFTLKRASGNPPFTVFTKQASQVVTANNPL